MARQRGDRRSVHDVARRTFLEHARQERVDAVQDPEHVDTEEPVPVFDLQILHVAEDENAGVVAQHMDSTELRVRSIGECLHRREVGHVGPDRERPGAECLRLVGNRASGLLLDVGDDHVHAGARELEHDGAPDTASSAGHDCSSTREIVHVLLAHVLSFRSG